MRVFLALLGVATIVVFAVGAPFAPEQPALVQRWQSTDALLPMTFAHNDHVEQNCLDCHHNYVDDTGSDSCMTCHVTNQEIYPLLEEQFHDLCRGCHIDEQLEGRDSGPTRSCIDCHLDEQMP